jgi:hypothetical protein
MDKMALTRRLETLLIKTDAVAPLIETGWWEGDAAGKRKVMDDLKAGRLFLKAANRCAEGGLRALAEGQLDLAETYAWEAYDQYIGALEAQVRRMKAGDGRSLHKPAKRRGRPPGSPNVKGRN